MEEHAVASLGMVNLDCADPPRLAEFYGAVLGWEVTHSEADYAMISSGTTSIGFGRIEHFAPPTWPDTSGSKRYHLDLMVDDLDDGERRCVELGASVPEFQPGGERWRVLLDPSGQPFCLARR